MNTLSSLSFVSLSSAWWWPFVVLAVGVVFIIVAISWWRLHAFLALLLASLVVGMMASRDSWGVVGKDGKEVVYSHWVGVVELIAKGLGDTARDIAISIALASVIGMCLMESGAADKVVRRFLKVFGEKRAGWALLWSTYVLSIPIFFDTMFMLMVPLAKALRIRTGKDYLLYLLCICCGGMITHALTIPHPGPIAMVDTLQIDIGVSLITGILGGILPAAMCYGVCSFLNSRMVIPLRGDSAEEDRTGRPESELPSFFWSILPVILPIVLIGFSSLFRVISDGATGPEGRQVAWCIALYNAFGGANGFTSVRAIVDFVGHKNIALLIGACVALWVLARERGFGKEKIGKLVGPPLETAGMIILITSAGGAFGGMLRAARVGDAVKTAAEGQAINFIVLAFVVSLVIRVAQGSATVAMLTTASMIAPMLDTALEFNRVYIYLAIGFGASSCSWMNDSGFWVVSRLSGMTQKETLQSWTILSTAIAFSGLIVTLLGSVLLPLK